MGESGTKKAPTMVNNGQAYFDGGFHTKPDTDNKEIYTIKVSGANTWYQ